MKPVARRATAVAQVMRWEGGQMAPDWLLPGSAQTGSPAKVCSLAAARKYLGMAPVRTAVRTGVGAVQAPARVPPAPLWQSPRAGGQRTQGPGGPERAVAAKQVTARLLAAALGRKHGSAVN